MLQKLRDSVNVEKYVNYIRELEEYIRSLIDFFQQCLKTSFDRIIIAYSGYGYLPASVMYWFIVTMDNGKIILLNEVDVVTHYILSYTENSYTILFTTNPYSASTIRFLQTTSLLNNQYIVVSMKPFDNRVLNLLSRFRVFYIDRKDDLESCLTMSILTYYTMANVYRDKLGSRGSRIYSHVVEGLYPIVEELINKYIDKIEKIVQTKTWVLTSTKILEPVSYFATEVLNRIGLSSSYKILDHVMSGDNVLIISTSVEEHVVREYKYKYGLMRNNVEDIVLNTDPLEAQIYLAILFYYILYSFKRDRGEI
ncbi:MAG: hypothetical protein QXW87_04855 [Desulfurococcaceae archaeon]